MELLLVAIDEDLALAWEDAFAAFPEVRILEGDILALAENTIVSPANSYGFMDGGIDRLYTDFFGLRPQTEVQERIARRPEGLLPVGAAELVETGHARIPFMIAAPTMVSPDPVDRANAFFAMSAVLQTAAKHPSLVRKVFCPGLATGTGRVAPEFAAEEMAHAYRKWKKKALIQNLNKPSLR